MALGQCAGQLRNIRSRRVDEVADNENAEIHLKRRKEVLPVSRSYLHLFRQM